MTDPKTIRFIDQMCVKNGDIEVKNIRKDGSYTLIVPVINGSEEFNEKQIATLEMESYFDGDEFVLLNFPKNLLSNEDYIYVTESLEAELLYDPYENAFEELMALAAEGHFKENCSVDGWSFDLSGANTFVISYSGEPVVVCDNNQITDAKWGSRIAGVEVYDVLRSVLQQLPDVLLEPVTIRTDEGFSILGYDGPSLRIADIPGMEDIDYYRAWVTSKPNTADPAKKDHIVYWDQGNTWCEVLAVFQGVTHEEFVREMHKKYNQWIQEETDFGDMEDTKASLSDQIQSISNRTADSKSAVQKKGRELEPDV